jgi:hypothetical protein
VPAAADCPVGKRTFVATLIIDDPCNDDELELPAIAFQHGNDEPDATQFILSGEWSKTITPNFGVTIGENWIDLHTPGRGSATGFDNLATSFKCEFVRDGSTETVFSTALLTDWRGTGRKAVGAESFTTFTPIMYAGKGFNFLPESMKFLRPLGITGELGYAFPTASSTAERDEDTGALVTNLNPQTLVWGGSVQYSMAYLKSRVQDLGLPDVVNHLIPIVEWELETETSNFSGREPTTGTINPGLIYLGEKIQLSVEAIIPVNNASGDGLGVIGALHLHSEELFPNSWIGKPLFGASQETEKNED